MKDGETTLDRAERSKLRRAEVLKVARELFLRLPYSQVSVEAIAAEVGVSKVTIYSYFDSKQGIYCAILTRDAQALLDRFEAAVRPTRGVDANLLSLSDAYAQFMADHPEYFQRFSWYFLPGREQRLPAEVGAQIGEKFAAAQTLIENCLASAHERGEIAKRDFRLCASALYSQWVGLAYLTVLNQPASGRAKMDYRRIRAESNEIFLRGVR